MANVADQPIKRIEVYPSRGKPYLIQSRGEWSYVKARYKREKHRLEHKDGGRILIRDHLGEVVQEDNVVKSEDP